MFVVTAAVGGRCCIEFLGMPIPGTLYLNLPGAVLVILAALTTLAATPLAHEPACSDPTAIEPARS